MSLAAQFFLKVYDKTGATIRQTIGANKIIGVPTIVRDVSAAGSDLTIDIAMPWDDFGFGEANGINYYDLVKIYAQNENNPGGVVVFAGFITEIHCQFDAKDNHITLRLLPIEAVFANAFPVTT